MAQIFSSCESLELIGLSGRKMKAKMPTMIVMIPIRRNMICHEVKVFAV